MSSEPHSRRSLPLDAVRRIDNLCDDFETALKSDGQPTIEAYLESIEPGLRLALLASLLEVEIEYRQAWGEVPTASDYLKRFALQSDVVMEVFDRVDARPEDSATREACLLQIALANASGRRMERLRVYCRGVLVHTTILSGPLELGRQRPGEAAPFAITRGPQGDRLVVAPLQETTVSRRHVILTPEAENTCRIQNLSQVNPVTIPDKARLTGDQSAIFPLPIEISMGSLFVRIDRPAQAGDPSAAEGSSVSLESTERLTVALESPGLLKRLWHWRRQI